MMDVNRAIDDVLAKRDQAWETFARAANKHGYRMGFTMGFTAGFFVVAFVVGVILFAASFIVRTT